MSEAGDVKCLYKFL